VALCLCERYIGQKLIRQEIMKLSYHDVNGKMFHQKIHKGLIRIGRDTSMDLSLLDPTVSGVHASISKLDERYFLTDLNSTNGTKLNGSLISKSVLKQGDHIQLGEFSLWFELQPSQKTGGKIIDLEIITKKQGKPH